MSRRRYISTEISIDPEVNQLIEDYGFFAGLLYTWMIPHCEDNGTLTGDPRKILMQIVPGIRTVSVEDVVNALNGMNELGLIIWDRENKIIHFPESFYKYQTYISHDKRRSSVQSSVRVTAHQRKTPQNTAEHHTPAQNTFSPSPSPSPSLSPRDNLYTCASPDGDAQVRAAAEKNCNDFCEATLPESESAASKGGEEQCLQTEQSNPDTCQFLENQSELVLHYGSDVYAKFDCCNRIAEGWGLDVRNPEKAHFFRNNVSLCGKFKDGGCILIEPNPPPPELSCKKCYSLAQTNGESKPKSPFRSKRQQMLFEQFWQYYPKKKSKGRAERVWVKLAPTEELVQLILAGLERAKNSYDWQKERGKYIPYPAKWLMDKGWEDEHQADNRAPPQINQHCEGDALRYEKQRYTG